MRLLQAIRHQADRIASQLEDSKLFTHMGDRGSMREAIVANFLRPFLPESYGLSSGEVFSADGLQSAQIDIVVYDAIFSTILFRDSKTMLFPAESVFGTIEVKSRLDSTELEAAIQNIASLKRLRRRDSDMLDLLPSVRLDLGDGLGYNQSKRNAYVGFIFGYQGASAEAVVESLNRKLDSNPAAKQELPDFVFVAKPGYFVARFSVPPHRPPFIPGPGGEFSEFRQIKTDEDTWALFYLSLNICLGSLRLRAIDFHPLWHQIFNEAQKRATKA